LFTTKIEILLPLALCLNGSVKDEVAPDSLYLQGWTIDHGLLTCTGQKRIRERENSIKYMQQFYKDSQPIFDKFRLSPVLYITDVDMLFLRTPRWRQRRFSATWTLYSTVLHTSYRFKSPLSPAYGTYMDIGLMVDKVLEKGSQVSFIVPPTHPFQLVKLSQFTLAHGTSESNILSDSFHQLPADDISSHMTLQFKDLEDYFCLESAVPDSERVYRKKLHHALKSSVERGFNFVDNKRKCMFLYMSGAFRVLNNVLLSLSLWSAHQAFLRPPLNYLLMYPQTHLRNGSYRSQAAHEPPWST
jgi:hypothetical protein